MKRPFEHYLTFIEHELGCKFFDWQKIALRGIYDGKYPIVQGRLCGKFIAYRAAELLKEEMDRDAGNLPSRPYELDGYAINVVMCDENWGENIEWEKEKEL
jgi:hypothetical protein